MCATRGAEAAKKASEVPSTAGKTMCTETEEFSRKLGSFGPPRRPAPAEQRPGWPSVGGVTVDSGPPEKNDRAEQAQGSSLLLSGVYCPSGRRAFLLASR